MALQTESGAGRVRPQTVMLYYHRLGRPGGGAERMVCRLSGALAARGFDVHVVSWDSADDTSFYPLDPRVSWHRLGRRPGLSDKWRRTVALRRLLRACGARMLIGFVMSGDKTVYAAARWAGVRLVVAERNAPVFYRLRYSPPVRALTILLLHLADAIAVQFPEYAKGYPATLRRRIFAIPNPVDPVGIACSPATHVKGRFAALSVGRLDAVQKRPTLVLHAFARLAAAHPDWDLWFVGDGPERDRLAALADSLGLGGRVRVDASRPDIGAIYARAHLFVMASLWEGFPNALAEAMAYGLPAVGFREAHGVANLISDGETGWLADGRDDAADLARALDAAMSDGAERARRGERAAQAMTRYHPETLYDRWAEVLRDVLGEKRSPSRRNLTLDRGML